VTTWPTLLDAIDEGLESSPPVLVDLEPLHAALGPLPPALAGRARQTLHRMSEVEAALEQARAELSHELAALRALAANAPTALAASVPQFLDAKA
jgi:hypothetical protein